LRRAIVSEQESLPVFFIKVASSPLSLVLFLAVVFILLSQTPAWPKLRELVGRRGI
jgi:putative tricarboxylic transport membrane protein